MTIRVLHNYGGRNTKEQRILPGEYAIDDPALFGVADYLVENGHAVAVQSVKPETGTPEKDVGIANALEQLEAAQALLEGRTPDVPLGKGIPLTANERVILAATGHPTADIEPVYDPVKEPAPPSKSDKPKRK